MMDDDDDGGDDDDAYERIGPRKALPGTPQPHQPDSGAKRGRRFWLTKDIF